MTHDILRILKEKEKWHDKWKRAKTNNYYLTQFKRFRNLSVSLLRKRKQEYFSSLIINAQGNTGKIWNIVTGAVGLRSEQRILPDVLNQDTAEEFNEYFVNIGPQLANQLPQITECTQSIQSVVNTMVIEDITVDEIIAVVNGLRPKAAGLDQIPVKLIKDNIDILAGPLLHLFNHSLDSEIYPSEFKIAKVIPIYKDGDRSNPSSYRPISITSVINTVFEKILSVHINKFISKYNILSPHQHGFRPQKSTSSAVFTLTHLLNTALQQNKIAVVAYLDIRKAFDTVDHHILLNKINNLGLRGKIHNLLRSYLSNRKQQVILKNYTSTSQTVLTGVPQGSVLGPMLFSLYINDFPATLRHSQALMYADDTALLFTGDSLLDIQDKINAELENVFKWFTSNELTLNLSKTKYTVFHSRKKKLNTETLDISLQGIKLQQVFSYKYLGIFLDSDMHWKTHIKHLCSKLAYGCYILLKARECFEYPVLRILYFSFIQSHISYCIDSWGNTFTTYLDPVFRLQKRALRIITSTRTQSSTYLYSSLHVLPVHALYELKIAEVIHSIIDTNDPLPITLFKIPLRNTRAATNQCFNLPPCHNLYGKRLVEFNGALIWNSLPIHIKEARNFRSAVRKYFFEKYCR